MSQDHCYLEVASNHSFEKARRGSEDAPMNPPFDTSAADQEIGEKPTLQQLASVLAIDASHDDEFQDAIYAMINMPEVWTMMYCRHLKWKREKNRQP